MGYFLFIAYNHIYQGQVDLFFSETGHLPTVSYGTHREGQKESFILSADLTRT